MNKIEINHIHDKNINFFIGSGASVGCFPTLQLKIKNMFGEPQTIETLATQFGGDENDNKFTALFMYYYMSCIFPVISFGEDDLIEDFGKKFVVNNYKNLIRNILTVIENKGYADKRVNIFTTNYDGCLEMAADELLSDGERRFVINDGTAGFFEKKLDIKNFNTYVTQMGAFEKNKIDIPQINLIHAHGSVYWERNDETIKVDYKIKNKSSIINDVVLNKLGNFFNAIEDGKINSEDLIGPELTNEEKKDFWSKYKKLQIVNPTKFKFHETVFDEYYYQMLRNLSFELEKNNTVLITFGFSFADEHIRNIVKRALSNPSLIVYICCYSNSGYLWLNRYFKSFNNVKFVVMAGDVMDFYSFNNYVFCLDEVLGQPLRKGD